jgi:hypothetical protein
MFAPKVVHTERRAGDSVRFSEREVRGSYKIEKVYFETDKKEIIFGLQKSGRLFLGLSKVSKNANLFLGCLKVKAQF